MNPNVLEYPSGDDHPSSAGNLRATAEFAPLLNLAYNRWKGGVGPGSTTTTTTGGNTCAVKEMFGPDSQATARLRDFRDTVLVPSTLGRAATRLNYAASPLLVGIMQKNHCVAVFVRTMIDGVRHCRAQQEPVTARRSWQLAQRGRQCWMSP